MLQRGGCPFCLPALERLLLNWPALRSYSVSQQEDECSKIIWEAFKDEEEESYAQMVCLFLQNIMQIFSNNIKLLERENTSSAELHEVMTAVRKKIIERKEDQYFGKLVLNRMKTVAVEDCKKEKFRNEANSFLDKCISYLEKWYDFDKSSFKFMGVLSLKQPVKWDDLTSLCENLKIDLDMDKLYDDFCLVREVQTSLCEASDRVDLRWVEFFKKVTAQGCGSELLKLVSFVLSVPVSNATCERQFSVMNQSFSKERRKITVEPVADRATGQPGGARWALPPKALKMQNGKKNFELNGTRFES